jgi:hypothetical protein
MLNKLRINERGGRKRIKSVILMITKVKQHVTEPVSLNALAKFASTILPLDTDPTPLNEDELDEIECILGSKGKSGTFFVLWLRVIL